MCLDDVSKEEIAYTQGLIDYLTISMAVYSGHPEKYADLQDRIGELVFDSRERLTLTSEEAVERAKSLDTLWISIDKQE